jgi:HSP20 family protein
MFRPIRWEGEAAAPEIKVDVEENDKAYVVKAEIPGVKKEDIDVQIDGNVVSISAESKREKKVEEKGKVIRSERYYGSMLRSFSLAHDVDQAEANAKYTDGILELTLPKAMAPRRRSSRSSDGRSRRWHPPARRIQGSRRAGVCGRVAIAARGSRGSRPACRASVRFGNADAELVVDARPN